MKNESFGRRIGGHMWKRLKGGIGGDVDDAALAANCHIAAEQVCKGNQRLYVDLNRRLLFSDVVGKEIARQSETRIIDQKIDLNLFKFKLLADPVDGTWIGQISVEGDATHAVIGSEASRQGLQCIDGARDQHQVHATRGECVRKSFPQSFGRPGDQRS